MKVFAPRRIVCAKPRSLGFCTGIPLEGDWIDVPDFFKQASRKGPINDVVHAKLVDSEGMKYYLWSQDVYTETSRGSPLNWRFEQTQGMFRYGDPDYTYGHWSFGTYEVSEDYVELAPSPNYKGKSPKKKYRRTYIKRMSPVAVFASFSSSGDSPKSTNPPIPAQKYGAFGGEYTFFTLPELLPELKVGPLPKGVVCEVKFRLNHKWTVGQTSPDYWFTPVTPGVTEVPSCLQSFAYSLWGETLINDNYHYTERHKWEERLARKLYQCIAAAGSELIDFLRKYQSKPSSRLNLSYFVGECTSDPIPDLDLRQAFLLNEPDIIGDRVDPMLLGRNFSNYWINYATQHAILKACESLPRLNDNSISNVLEIAGFIKSLVVDHKIEMPKSLADAWLAYRYQYGTTKLDINDAIKFVHRHMDLGTLDRQIGAKSTFSFNYKDVDIVCRCSIDSTPKNISQLKRIWRALDTYGLTPDFYVIWDMIPYSFMVDWFLPISDIASVWDADAMYFSGEYYTLENLCYSLKYTRELGQYKVQCYTRWAGVVPSSLNSFYWFDAPSASSQTVGRRILDAASIFIGR
jgi:hypothetical protein